MTKGAILSDDKLYRYSLWRIWDDSKPKVAFVGLNPSTADETFDDPTINRCINFAKDWGFGGFYMVNLFAYRATDPSELYSAQNPIGVDTDKHLIDTFKKTEKIICAWGNQGNFKQRNDAVLKLIDNPFCLQINGSGEPAHPLYLKKDLKPIEYKAKNAETKKENHQPKTEIKSDLSSLKNVSSNISVKYFSANDKEYLDRIKRSIGFDDNFHFEIRLSDGERILGESDVLLYGNFIFLFRSFRIGELYDKPNSGEIDATSKTSEVIIPTDMIKCFKAVKQNNKVHLEIEVENQPTYKSVGMKEFDFDEIDRLQFKLNELINQLSRQS